MQGGNLTVDGGQLLRMSVEEALRLLLDEREMAENTHPADGDAALIAFQEEPDGQQAEGGDTGQEHAHRNVHGLGEQVEHAGQQPEPEMGEDVCHDIEQDARRSPLRADVGRERHDAVWLAAHQPARRGIVEGEAAHRDLVKPQEGELPGREGLLRRLWAIGCLRGLRATEGLRGLRAFDDNPPCPCIKDV